MDQIIKDLQKLIINAKKSKGRKYTEETIQEKYHIINKYSKEFGKLVGNLADPLRQKKIEEFKLLKKTAIELLKEHTNSSNMSNFDSKKASDTIPIFDGKHAHLDIFLSMVEMVHEELNEQERNKLIKYVYAMKLNDRVRSILMTQDIPNTYDELRATLSKYFKSRKTTSSLHSEIRNIKQRGNVSGFREKLDALISELTVVQFNDLEDSSNEVARSTIRMLNEKLALETFQEGLQENIRTTVIAAQPKSLVQAFEIASTQERLLQATNSLNILHINNRGRHNYNNYNRNNQRRQNFNTNNHRTNRKHNNNYNNNNNDRNFNTFNRYRNNNNSRYYTNNAYNRNNRNTNNNHINQRNNHSNIRMIHQQGNEETPEIRNDSPQRENYRSTQ